MGLREAVAVAICKKLGDDRRKHRVSFTANDALEAADAALEAIKNYSESTGEFSIVEIVEKIN
jgi:hypothetical protein